MSEYSLYWQLPLLVVSLLISLFGGAFLLWVGWRCLLRTPAAKYSRCLATALIAGLCASVSGGGASLTAYVLAGSRTAAQITVAVGGVVSLLLVWAIIAKMLRVRYREAILAWLPTLAVVPMAWVPLLPVQRQARENIMRAACANCLREVGQAAMFAATDFKGYFPPSLAFLQDHRYLPQLPRCPSARSDAEPYFYCPWIADPNADLDGVYTSQIESMVQEVAQRFPEYTGRGWPIRLVNKDRLDGAVPIIACDFRNNHAGAGRNVLYADGTLKWMRESEFQTELRRDTNRWLAKALHAAENAH